MWLHAFRRKYLEGVRRGERHGVSQKRPTIAEHLRERFPGRRLRKRIAVLPPREVAILTVKFLRKNFQREKNARDSRSNELPGQLRIFDPGRLTLRATNGGADLRIARFPFQHHLVRLLEV